MNTKKIIKKTLNEVAGISFEVRKWAQIIETYVKDYINSEREKLKSQQPKVEPKKVEPKSGSYSWSYDNSDTPKDDYETEFTHFESHGGEEYDTALIYGQELYINADILDEFPNIESIIRSKLFEVTLDGNGDFTVDTIGSSFPDYYLTAILEIVQDHMTMGMAFHNNNYEEVFAVTDDDYYHYMNEDNRGGYGSYSYTPQPNINKIEINGKDFPEAYEDFKVDKWVITSSNRIEYDHWKSGYDESGEYVVYLNMPMYSVGGSALVHEVKHAYDDWNRMSKGAPPIRAGWEIQNIYTPDFEKLVLGGSMGISPMLHPIIRYYYLGSKLESPAYLENEYDSASVMGSYRDTAKKMMNFKASNFFDKKGNPAKGLQESWTDLITKYNIPFFRKFKNVVDFLNYTEKHFNKRGREIMKRIDKMRYVHNKPQPKYTSTVQKPTTQTAKPIQQTKSVYSSDEYKKLDLEIDKLEGEWDKKYAQYLKNNDPKLRKELDDLDTLINQKLNVLNNMFNGDLPF